MAVNLSLAILLLSGVAVQAADQHGTADAAANPIRKVVSMLQALKKKVEAEAEKEEKMFEKYMCWCKTGGGDLSQGIAAAGTKVPQVESDIEEAEAQTAQLKSDLKQAQVDRSAAKAAMAEASAIREKEAAAFAAEKAEYDANINALTKAVGALEKGMSGTFLQTSMAQVLKTLVQQSQDVTDGDRQVVLSFLSGGQGDEYAPKGGEITGILKDMSDTMKKSLAEATAEETSTVNTFKELMAAKTKEVSALTKAIETKTVRVGELSVQVVQMKNDLTETQQALLEDKDFLANLEKDCQTRREEWDGVCKTRQEELVALADTIKVLNDDDALELFKKTLPSASSSFVQVKAGAVAGRERALEMVRNIRKTSKTGHEQLDFIAMALNGKKVNFGKVIKMIDDMVALLKTEGADDDNKKEYCGVQFDALDDKKKGLERSVSDLETSIAEKEDSVATLASEIKALGAAVAALDKAVAEATEQRKEENQDFTALMASDSAAKELLAFAKNRLNKFYNPRVYKAPAKRELTEEERITVNNGGTLAPTAAPGGIAGTGVAVLVQVSAHVDRKDAPPPPPAAVGAYSKKSEESTGVIGMIDLLVKDLDKEMVEAETAEKDGQADYEQLMKDSAAKRASDSSALVEKGGAKAEVEGDLQAHKEEKTSTEKTLMATHEVIQALHGECDWLLQYYDVRKEARTAEIDSLTNAKAVLSGADFSLLQAKSRNLLKQE